MRDVFDRPWLTLRRAQYHVRNFKRISGLFIDGKPWTAVVEQNRNFTKNIYKIRFTKDLPKMLPCILFDATNNLRAVLDQAGYSTGLAAKKTVLKATKFPFGPSEKELRNNAAGGCKDLPPEILAIFKTFKGYKGGNNILWAVDQIANSNAHLTLRPLLLQYPSVFFAAEIIPSSSSADTVSPGVSGIAWNAEKREVTLLTAPSGADAKITANVAFEIAVDGVDVIAGEPAISFLDAAIREVERVLLATEAKCRQLGFIP